MGNRTYMMAESDRRDINPIYILCIETGAKVYG